MTLLTVIVMTIVLALMLLYTYRIILGPSVFDRIVALNAVGTKVPVVLILIGLLYERVDMFVDLALALFLLNLFTTLLVAKYVREKGQAEG